MLNNGTFLSDRYEILGKVGSGGMSDVYKAKCHKLNRYVAVKVLKQEFSEDKNFVSKFRAEAQAAAGLSHPNIVNIYDVGEDSGLYYIVMELVEGITLKTYIEKKGRLDVKEAVSIAIQVAQGIQTAHSHHIIHRDIKPQNIIISREGKVKVTDFGIARASSAQTINSNAMGSVHYISPEQARGSYSDERSDIYSLGISLYEMITGYVPFEGDTTVAVALQHIQGEIPSPRDVVPDLPISVEKIIYKCTQKKPERRYSKAAELIADLKRSLVTPDEDFVELSTANIAAPTVSLTQEEVTIINRTSRSEKEELPARRQQDRRPQDKKVYEQKFYEEEDEPEERVNPKIERMMTVLTVAAAILIVCLLVFIVVRLMPKPSTGGNTNTQGQTTADTAIQNTQNTQETESKKEETNGVPMPNVVGYTENDALIALNQANLGMGSRTYETSNEIEKGRVIRAEFNAGEVIPRNTSVALVISSGPEKVEMPDVTKRSEQAAAEILAASNLKYTTEYTFSDEVEQGYVVSSSPAKGTMVSPDDKVTIYLSQGPEFKDVKVPNLLEKTLEEAKLEIEKNSLIVGEISEDDSGSGTPGTIVSQSIDAGETVKEGTKINLVVAAERPALTGSVTINKSQVSKYITNDGYSFIRTNVPGPASSNLERYAEAIMKLELVQTTEDGRTISRVLETVTVTPASFPYTLSGFEGEPGLTEGSVEVTLTFGGAEYSCGSCLVDFQ